MPRIPPLEREQTAGEARAAFDKELARFGRLTNMKRTLLRSPPAYHALMEWYPLFDTIKAFLGERLATVFAHAISAESDCLICTTFMRRLLINSGENPRALNLDERGNALVEFGRAVVRPGNRVPDELYRKLAGFFNPEQLVALTAFASLMVATNMINNILEVDLDEYLYEYRDGQPLPKQGVKHGA
jgi:alkylhydroperoxidase family enzyme